MTPRSESRTRSSATSGAGVASSKVVVAVFDQILEAIHQGELLPGEHISDTKLAATLGISRTPVREALQRLREIGVVEASASRFTRVAVVSPRQTAEAMVVWLAMFKLVIDEVVPTADDAIAATMATDHAAFQRAVAALDMEAIATANFVFFARLTALTKNSSLRNAIRSVVHIIRLGSLHLPEYVDFAALSSAQSTLLEAVRTHNLPLAHNAMSAIGSIRIPIEPTDG